MLSTKVQRLISLEVYGNTGVYSDSHDKDTIDRTVDDLDYLELIVRDNDTGNWKLTDKGVTEQNYMETTWDI